MSGFDFFWGLHLRLGLVNRGSQFQFLKEPSGINITLRYATFRYRFTPRESKSQKSKIPKILGIFITKSGDIFFYHNVWLYEAAKMQSSGIT